MADNADPPVAAEPDPAAAEPAEPEPEPAPATVPLPADPPTPAEALRPASRLQKQAEAPEDGAGRRGAGRQPPSPPTPPAEPSAPAQPAEPVRMTPAQERALRYIQRQDRYMELLARNTHEF